MFVNVSQKRISNLSDTCKLSYMLPHTYLTAGPQRSVMPIVKKRKLSLREVKQFVWIFPVGAQESRKLNLVSNFGVLPPTTIIFSSRIIS